MVFLVVALLLTAEPLIVVLPFEIKGGGQADANLGRAFASLVEADLKAAGVPVRTEDDLDRKNWGSIKGASHVVTGAILNAPGRMLIVTRVIALPDALVGAANLTDPWKSRLPLVKVVLRELHQPLPAGFPEVKVEAALMRAWGDALQAIHEGDPAAAKLKVADVVKRWPAFTPAKDRLAQL